MYYTINTIEDALSANKAISFFYFNLNEKRERIYHREKSRYVVEPVSMVLLRDKYYLTAVSPHREGLSVYRIDRMEAVQQEAHTISRTAIRLRSSVAEYVEKAFKMFAGETRRITLEFHEELIGAVFDRFGEQTKIRRIAPQTCRCNVAVQISPAFWGWLLQFGAKLRVTAPLDVVNQVKAYLAELPYKEKDE
ncbi:MAG: WYL domain-containing protein [Oscillospiraceae bacterium]|nr:WYL domain-containing protein [Oscillospiraceae bacterium]